MCFFVVFLMRGLITASLKFFGTYLNNIDKLIIFRRGSMTSRNTSFSSLDNIGSNIHVVLDDLTSLIQFFLFYSRE